MTKRTTSKGRSAVSSRSVSKATARKSSDASKRVRGVVKGAKTNIRDLTVPNVKVPNVKAPKIVNRDIDDTGLDQLDPATTEARDATHLRRIVAAARALEDAEDDLRRAVEEAREDGESWAVIGAALGVTRQGAYQRFGR